MKKTFKDISYSGKNVFVGIDVHKKSYSVVAKVGGEIAKKWTAKASPIDLAKQLTKYFQGAKLYTAYEAGFSAFVLHRQLEEYGIHSIVVHVPSIEVAVNNRVKTDKRDAKKLASLLEAGRLEGVRVPTEKEELNRMLTRTRQQLVEDRAAVKNKIWMKFHQLGLIEPDNNQRITHKSVQEHLERPHSKELTLVVEAYCAIWKSLDEQIAKLDNELKLQAVDDPNESTYRSAPGIGRISARVLSNELGDLSQFKNERQLFSFTGLTPSEYSTGENVRRGHITRQGNTRVRAILVEAAWRAVRKDKSLGRFFEKLYTHTGKKKAIVAVARKLIGRIRAAFQNKEKYRIKEV